MNPSAAPHSQRMYGLYCNGFRGNFWLWEVLVLVLDLMRASGNMMMEPRAMREHGHFYNGLRAGFWRWEVVKRMDVLCDYLET